MSTQKSSLQIGFVIFPDVTQLDFTGPWEVLSRLPDVSCHLISRTRDPVPSGSGGLIFQPTMTFEDCPPLDIVLVPGGHGHLQAMLDARLLEFLRRQAEHCRYVTAVCTGSLVLAAAGLLRGYRATTHWLSIDRLAQFGAIPVSERVVIDRNRMTGGGVTAGIDFALALMALLSDETTARSTQLQMEYAPAPPFADGNPASADQGLVAAMRERLRPYSAKMAEIDAKALAAFRS
jgi:cyclohexyl-isocyanide hydratase